ncbi:c-type cytochrome [Parvularcula marina]|uniref:Cytochrome c family protein n=1 Tax=Parvularcula marina TaxID=2292771 RepID=A0A371RJ99_9PROT|nr:c-type cytochrome [Parvularcula marina]RFB05525.1 cytochrome c family protein [Parvularcula marina]
MTPSDDKNKDPLFGNKVAAAVLTTLLIAFGLPIIITTLTNVFGGHHGAEHHDEANPFGLAYIPAEIVLEGGGAAEAAPEIDLGTLLASASADRGERAAGLCKACHTFEAGGDNGIGPNLWGIMGKEVASVPGFGYSGPMSDLGGVWTYQRVDHLLENSQAFLPGTQMAQMVRKDEKRADILAFLQTLADEPYPFPEPAPASEEGAEESAAMEEGDHAEDSGH